MKRYAFTSMMALCLVSAVAVAGGQNATPAADQGQHKPMDHKKQEHGQQKPAASTEFTQLDANKDGALSKDELATHRLASHFGMLDSNKDGKLSPQEFSAGKGM